MRAQIDEFLEKLRSHPFDSNGITVIAIQGPSTSGKSTLAVEIFESLKKLPNSNIKPMLLSIDSFYKDFSDKKHLIDHSKYDMDNPAAFDWTCFADCVEGYLSKSPIVYNYSYTYAEKKRKEHTLSNENYNVLIVEGIFAHNLFNEEVFDIEKFDCTNSSNNYSIPLIKNYFKLKNYKFNLFKVFLDIERDIMLQTRIIVDYQRDKRPKELSVELFEKQIYPSTVNWVIPTGRLSSDIVIENGTKNIQEVSLFFKILMSYFQIEDDGTSFFNKLTQLKQRYDRFNLSLV